MQADDCELAMIFNMCQRIARQMQLPFTTSIRSQKLPQTARE